MMSSVGQSGRWLAPLVVLAAGAMAGAEITESFEAAQDGPLGGQNQWTVNDTAPTCQVEVATQSSAADGAKVLRILDDSPDGLIITHMLAEPVALDGVKISFAVKAETPGDLNNTGLHFAPLVSMGTPESLDIPLRASVLASGKFGYITDKNNNLQEAPVAAQVGKWYRFDCVIHWTPEDNGRTHYDLTVTDLADGKEIFKRTNELSDHVGPRDRLAGLRFATDGGNAAATRYQLDAIAVKPPPAK